MPSGGCRPGREHGLDLSDVPEEVATYLPPSTSSRMLRSHFPLASIRCTCRCFSPDEWSAGNAGFSERSPQPWCDYYITAIHSRCEPTITSAASTAPSMSGSVTVQAGGPSTQSMSRSSTSPSTPPTSTVGIGGQVTWTNNGPSQHSVVESGGDNLPSFCFNGRSFVGNTPTIIAHAGQRIRWYVFNLDLGMGWHNFHPHAQRWKFANQMVDVRSIGPAESFYRRNRGPAGALVPARLRTLRQAAQRRQGISFAGRFPGALPCRDAHDARPGRAASDPIRRCISLRKKRKSSRPRSG